MAKKPTLYKGKYSHMQNGIEYYTADYYIPIEVDTYIRKLKKRIKKLKEKVNG